MSVSWFDGTSKTDHGVILATGRSFNFFLNFFLPNENFHLNKIWKGDWYPAVINWLWFNCRNQLALIQRNEIVIKLATNDKVHYLHMRNVVANVYCYVGLTWYNHHYCLDWHSKSWCVDWSIQCIRNSFTWNFTPKSCFWNWFDIMKYEWWNMIRFSANDVRGGKKNQNKNFRR